METAEENAKKSREAESCRFAYESNGKNFRDTKRKKRWRQAGENIYIYIYKESLLIRIKDERNQCHDGGCTCDTILGVIRTYDQTVTNVNFTPPTKEVKNISAHLIKFIVIICGETFKFPSCRVNITFVFIGSV